MTYTYCILLNCHKNRYRVELTVCDQDNVATFVVFDQETTKLAGRKAADILEEDGQV